MLDNIGVTTGGNQVLLREESVNGNHQTQ